MRIVECCRGGQLIREAAHLSLMHGWLPALVDAVSCGVVVGAAIGWRTRDRRFSIASVDGHHSGGTVVEMRRQEGSMKVNVRHKVAAGVAAGAALLSIGGGIAAAHTIASTSPQTPIVQGPTPAVPAPEPSNGPDIPGQPDLPEPGDVPDAPGQ
jgi:hypothetical protein